MKRLPIVTLMLLLAIPAFGRSNAKKKEAKRPQALAALRSAINTAGDAGANMWNRDMLRDLRVSKDTDSGILRIEITFVTKETSTGTWEMVRGTGRSFLVRLFDKNGAYITHVVTDPPAVQLPENPDHRYRLDFKVSQRDLQFAEQVEVGIAPD